MCKHKSNWDYDQIYAKVSQNSINLLENPSNKEKIWSETSKTVCWDILLQEQYGRCSDTVYWAKNSIAHHPCYRQTDGQTDICDSMMEADRNSNDC